MFGNFLLVVLGGRGLGLSVSPKEPGVPGGDGGSYRPLEEAEDIPPRLEIEED